MLALLEACHATEIVLDPSQPSEETWRSFIEKNQDRLRMEAATGCWVRSSVFPLAPRVPNRTSQLRAYGNSIVPQCGQAFIEAYLDAINETPRP